VQCAAMEVICQLPGGEAFTKPVAVHHTYWFEVEPSIRAVLSSAAKCGGIAVYRLDHETGTWGWHWTIWSESPAVSL
jgi:hypothetical protein